MILADTDSNMPSVPDPKKVDVTLTSVPFPKAKCCWKLQRDAWSNMMEKGIRVCKQGRYM